jgi:hypothetical protein
LQLDTNSDLEAKLIGPSKSSAQKVGQTRNGSTNYNQIKKEKAQLERRHTLNTLSTPKKKELVTTKMARVTAMASKRNHPQQALQNHPPPHLINTNHNDSAIHTPPHLHSNLTSPLSQNHHLSQNNPAAPPTPTPPAAKHKPKTTIHHLSTSTHHHTRSGTGVTQSTKNRNHHPSPPPTTTPAAKTEPATSSHNTLNPPSEQ